MTANKTGEVNTSTLQQKEPIYKESGMSDLASTNSSSLTHSSNVNDKDYQPPGNSDEVITVTRTRRKIVAPIRYAPFATQKRGLQNHESERVTVQHTRKKRKLVPPVRYAPFAQQNLQNYDGDQSHTSNSECDI